MEDIRYHVTFSNGNTATFSKHTIYENGVAGLCGDLFSRLYNATKILDSGIVAEVGVEDSVITRADF